MSGAKKSAAQNMLRMFLVAVGVVLAFEALVFMLSRQFLFPGSRLSLGAVTRLGQTPHWRVARIFGPGQTELLGLIRSSTSAENRWMLFFGGNAFDLGAGQWVLDTISDPLRENAAVFAYRGYDGSKGVPAEATLKEDARAIISALERDHGALNARWFLIGQSLGSGVAAHLAAQLSDEGRPAAGLILLSPYTSIASVFDDHVPILPVGFFVRDPFRTDRLAKRITCPTLLVHGRQDQLIPFAHSQRLKELLEDRATLVPIEKSGHALWDDDETARAVREFLAKASS